MIKNIISVVEIEKKSFKIFTFAHTFLSATFYMFLDKNVCTHFYTNFSMHFSTVLYTLYYIILQSLCTLSFDTQLKKDKNPEYNEPTAFFHHFVHIYLER